MSNSHGLLANKVAAVTGASRGLGLAIARAFVDEGATVMAACRNEAGRARTDASLQELRPQGGEWATLAADLSEADAPERIVRATVERFGRLDVLVNNAAVFVRKPFLELSAEEWNSSVQTNLTAPFNLMQAAARQFIRQESPGAIVNIASIHAKVADGNLVAQCTTKFGLVGLTQAAAEALRPQNVRVNVICPGAIEPDSSSKLGGTPDDPVSQGDVAQVAVYLASERSKPLTGTSIDAFGASRPVVHKPF